MEQMKYSIVIPAKDEHLRLEKSMNSFTQFLKDKDTEIIVVVNNSSDNTIDIALEYASKYDFVKVINVNKKDIPYTKGLAVKVGMLAAVGEFVGYIDGDRSTTEQEAFRLLNLLSESDSDVVIANRYDPESDMSPSPTFLRTAFSRAFNLIVRIGFGLNYKDTQCGAKFFKSNVAKEAAGNMITYGWIFDIDVLSYCQRAGYKIQDVPTIWKDSENSQLKIWKTFKSVSISLVKLKIKYIQRDLFNINIEGDENYDSVHY
jgi:glycosyltransferase involved in cell wall biosynthesis